MSAHTPPSGLGPGSEVTSFLRHLQRALQVLIEQLAPEGNVELKAGTVSKH